MTTAYHPFPSLAGDVEKASLSGSAVVPLATNTGSNRRVRIFEGELKASISPVWQIVVFGVSLDGQPSPDPNGPELAKGFLSFGEDRSAMAQIRFDIGRGTVLTVPAGFVHLSVSCETSSRPTTTALGAGRFAAWATPGFAARGVTTLYDTVVTESVAANGVSAMVQIPLMAEAVKVYPSLPNTVVATQAYIVRAYNRAANTVEMVNFQPASGAGGYQCPVWAEFGQRSDHVEIQSLDASARQFVLVFRLRV